MATSWKVGEGGRTYTFALREDVTFHDGSRLDASAMKANLDPSPRGPPSRSTPRDRSARAAPPPSGQK
ncbi:ABC transporter substrate-binding protein [Streptomyces sp. NPDC058335]|uniref:ABC transporter substrate-binding protein n=1 Tax=Streptomyces sp. NPDC058335 TaxID=3346451 RepID=UPI00365F1CE4